jgi:hypothetical protein
MQWNKEGECARKPGNAAPKNQESQRKEERCISTRKTVGFWTSRNQGFRKWTNIIHLGSVG